MDAELLARIQFGFTAAFHFIYPPISIGLGLILVIMEGAYLKTHDPAYEAMTKFWIRIFALVFAVGVATGIVLEFEFGTNWAAYSRFVGDIFGSALAAEGIFAFFLESGFLALLVFGWNRVKPPIHFLSTILVALGSTFSAVWIIVANSWQQTPAGFILVKQGGHYHAQITDFWAMVFNPSSIDRLAHTVVGAWATGAFFVISVSAFYLLRKRHEEFAKNSLKIALPIAVIACLLQPVIGHFSIAMIADNQQAKLAAMEGHYRTGPLGLSLIGWTDQDARKTTGLTIPGLGSLLLTGDRLTPVAGLDAVRSRAKEPPVNAVFQSYHLMIWVGMLMIALALVTAWFFIRGKLAQMPWLLRIMIVAVVLPHIANQTGWLTAELGRQPWIVYNQLLTKDGLSQVVSAGQILTSLLLFTLVYILLFVLFIYLLDQKIRQGPTAEDLPSKRLERGLNV
jgi:cytochrome d ubiquinol oxidase subunit I